MGWKSKRDSTTAKRKYGDSNLNYIHIHHATLCAVVKQDGQQYMNACLINRGIEFALLVRIKKPEDAVITRYVAALRHNLPMKMTIKCELRELFETHETCITIPFV